MIDDRLPLALEKIELSSDGIIAVMHPAIDANLSALPKERILIVSPLATICAHFEAQGYRVTAKVSELARFTASVVCLTRARAETKALLAVAMNQTDGIILIDGQKTDGANSILKALRSRVNVGGSISKSHGKVFWCDGGSDFKDWAVGPALQKCGFWTAAGVFSADGVDPASALLIEALPDSITGRVADLGAGWGYLSAHILTRAAVVEVHLVEAHNMALQCARHNVLDHRASFHWVDAIKWAPSNKMDAVVMNPPFHTGRSVDPTLGRSFITASARLLKPQGMLWMVANRHLPYEKTLMAHFSKVVDLGGNARFKVLRAERPK